MIKLRTPLVMCTVLAVAVLSIVRAVLEPDSWPSSVAAFAFLPIAIGIIVLRSRSTSGPQSPIKLSGRLRAGLVGAGVLLATSLLLSITDSIGLTGQGSGEESRSLLIVMLPAVMAVAADILSSRLERRAKQDPE